MSNSFTKKINNGVSTLLSTHTSGGGTIVIQPGDQTKFPSTFPFKITVYIANTTLTSAQSFGTVFLVNSASSNTFNVTTATDESPTAVDQTFTVGGTYPINVEVDWTYGTAMEYEKALETGWIPVLDTWTYSSWDSTSATGIVTVPTGATSIYSIGMKVWFTESAASLYGIITAVASTTLTIFFGSSYTLTNNTISAIYFSPAKAPYGFPMSPSNWMVNISDTADHSQASPASGTWYNATSIVVPIGAWYVSYFATANPSQTASGAIGDEFTTLSTANNSESDTDYTEQTRTVVVGSTGINMRTPMNSSGKGKALLLAAKTTYYLNYKTSIASEDQIGILGSTSTPTVIRAISAYL